MMMFRDVTETPGRGQPHALKLAGRVFLVKTVFSAQDLKFLVISSSLSEPHAKSFLLFMADVEG